MKERGRVEEEKMKGSTGNWRKMAKRKKKVRRGGKEKDREKERERETKRDEKEKEEDLDPLRDEAKGFGLLVHPEVNEEGLHVEVERLGCGRVELRGQVNVQVPDLHGDLHLGLRFLLRLRERLGGDRGSGTSLEGLLDGSEGEE